MRTCARRQRQRPWRSSSPRACGGVRRICMQIKSGHDRSLRRPHPTIISSLPAGSSVRQRDERSRALKQTRVAPTQIWTLQYDAMRCSDGVVSEGCAGGKSEITVGRNRNRKRRANGKFFDDSGSSFRRLVFVAGCWDVGLRG